MITFSRSGYDPSLQCQCNTECPQHSNCCPDYDQECGGGGGGSLSDADLLELSEMLIRSLIDYCLFVSQNKMKLPHSQDLLHYRVSYLTE